MLGLLCPNAPGSSNTDTGTYLNTHTKDTELTLKPEIDPIKQKKRRNCTEQGATRGESEEVSNNSLLAIFLRFSTGLKWMVGMGQTICMGSASTRQEFFLSQPAPSRYKPRTNTPSLWVERQREQGINRETQREWGKSEEVTFNYSCELMFIIATPVK